MSTSQSQTQEFCIPNINSTERRRRLGAGLLGLATAVAVLVALLLAGASVWWRLVLFPLFWAAASGIFQWREKT